MPTAPTSPLDRYISAKHSTLGDVVLALNRRFIIPRNQRPWAWKEASKIQDLLSDFSATIAKHYDGSSSPRWGNGPVRQEPPHFFGTFVFYERNQNEFEVFDGQQRITSISMLCAVLQEVAFELSRSPDPSSAVRATALFGGFQQWLLTSISSSHQPRLVPSQRFYAVFDALIFGTVTNEERQSKFEELPQSLKDNIITKRLKSSFYQIRSWVQETITGYNNQEKVNFLNASHSVLRTHFVCVETIIKDEPYAFQVFECLNARGVSLSEEDQVKNELFKKSEQRDHVEISNSWDSLNDNIRNQQVGEFLRRRFIALHEPCKKSEIYQKIKSIEINQADDPKELVSIWVDDSRLHSQLELRDANLFNEKAQQGLRSIFEILGVSLAVIPLLAAGKRFAHADPTKFEKCVELTEKFVFRQLTIISIKTPELEMQLGNCGRALSSHGDVGRFEAMLRRYSKSRKFREEFASFSTRNKAIQYYILSKIETHLLGGGRGVVPGSHDQAGNNLEHILPKRLSNRRGRDGEWAWARRDPELHKGMVNRLGNLLILENDINRVVESYEFDVKQTGIRPGARSDQPRVKGYCDSSLEWPARLANRTEWTKWTDVQIEKRQKQMAHTALEVWKI